MFTLIQLHGQQELDNTLECMRSEFIIKVQVSSLIWSKTHRKHEQDVEKRLWQEISLDAFLENKTWLPLIPGAKYLVQRWQQYNPGSQELVITEETDCHNPFFPLSSVPPTSPSKCFIKMPSFILPPTRVQADL